jgi:hypothetical protein
MRIRTGSVLRPPGQALGHSDVFLTGAIDKRLISAMLPWQAGQRVRSCFPSRSVRQQNLR